MGYRVEYEPLDRAFRCKKQNVLRMPMLSACFFTLFILLVFAFWTQGADALQAALFYGDWPVTRQALENFAADLKMGEPIGTSIDTFCRMVFAEAGIVFH